MKMLAAALSIPTALVVAVPAQGQRLVVPLSPTLPGGFAPRAVRSMSPDGSVVIVDAVPTGDGANAAEIGTFRYRLGATPELVAVAPDFVGTAIDASGMGIVGRSSSGAGSFVSRWDEGLGESRSQMKGAGTAISADGSTVVGNAAEVPGTSPQATAPVRWARGEDPVVILDPGPTDSATADAVSADGNVVVGTLSAFENVFGPSGSVGFHWEAPGTLTTIDAGLGFTYVRNVSADGAFVVGGSLPPFGVDSEAFLWSAVDGFVPIELPASWQSSELTSLSDTGLIAAGSYVDAQSGLRKPFVWSASTGVLPLFGDAFGLVDPAPEVSIEVAALSGSGLTLALRAAGATPVDEPASWMAYLSRPLPATISEPTCSAQEPNSTGAVGGCIARGTAVAAMRYVELQAQPLPPGQIGMFLIGTRGQLTPLGGGTLCLGGDLGRVRGSIFPVPPNGLLRRHINVAALPLASGARPAQPGETLYFQAWHRDTPDAGLSNLSDACQVTFL